VPPHLIQTNFGAGEIDPRLIARVDLKKYQDALDTLENAYVLPQGGVVRRSGFRFIEEVKGRDLAVNGTFDADSDWAKGTGWTISGGVATHATGTESDLSQDVGLVAGKWYEVKFTVSGYSAGSLTPLCGTTTGSAVSSNETSTQVLLAAGDSTLRLRASSDADFDVDNVEVREMWPIARLIPFQYSTTQAYILELTDYNLRVYKDGGIIVDGSDPVEVATPWSEAQIFDVNFTQSADVMYMVHESVAPYKLTRSSHTSWTLTAVSFTSAPAAWAASDYPSQATFFEERLCFACSPSYPQTIWMSKSGSYEDFGVSDPVVDSDACTYTISADEVNAIRWLVSQKKLLIGTVGGEWWLNGGSGSDIVTPDAVLVRRETVHGSAAIQPLVIGNVVLFLQRDGSQTYGKRLREFVYSLEADGYQAPDLTVLAGHMTHNSPIKSWGFQQTPNGIAWMVREDGVLIAMTYQRDHNIVGFSRHITDGEFESVASIPGDNDDEVWAVVSRYAQTTGSTMVVKRFVERMDPEFSPCQEEGVCATRDAFFVDAGLTHDDPVDISDITSADPVVVTATAHGLTTGDTVLITGIEGHTVDGTSYGTTDLNGNKYEVTVTDADHFSLADPLTGENIDGSTWPAYTSGGEVRKLKTSFTGMDHLAGRDIAILADGAPRDNATVDSNGAFTLTEPAATVHAGLPYNTNIKTLRLEGGVQTGTAQGKTKRIMSVTLRLHETLGVACGPDAETLQWIDFRNAEDRADAPPALFSGDKRICFSGGYDREGQVYVRQSYPLPFTLLGVMPEGVVYGN